MSRDRLNQIKERLANATPGPWGWSGCANDRVDVCSRAPGWEGAEIAVVKVDYEFNNRDELADGMPVMDRAMAHSNAALIMHAPEDLRELVAEIEMLRGVGCGELREGAEVADGPCGACLKCARRERDEARAEVERLNERLESEQHFIDAACHYRNLAIVLGAKPEQMLGTFDRELCEGGIDPNETSGGYHVSVNQQLDALKDVWAEVESLRKAVQQVHALAEKGRDFAASEAVRDIYKITKGLAE